MGPSVFTQREITPNLIKWIPAKCLTHWPKFLLLMTFKCSTLRLTQKVAVGRGAKGKAWRGRGSRELESGFCPSDTSLGLQVLGETGWEPLVQGPILDLLVWNQVFRREHAIFTPREWKLTCNLNSPIHWPCPSAHSPGSQATAALVMLSTVCL